MLSLLLREESSPLNNECLSKATIHRSYCLLGNGKSFYLLTNGSSITEQSRAQCKAPHVSSAAVRRSVTAPLPLTVMKRNAEGCQTRQAPVQMRSCEFLENIFKLQMLTMFGEAGRFLRMCELALDDGGLV